MGGLEKDRRHESMNVGTDLWQTQYQYNCCYQCLFKHNDDGITKEKFFHLRCFQSLVVVSDTAMNTALTVVPGRFGFKSRPLLPNSVTFYVSVHLSPKEA